MQWIKGVELVDSVDDLRSSSSIRSIPMPNFEALDARIASALNRIIHNSHFKRRISLEEQRPIWSTITSGSLGAMILSKITPTYALLFFKMMIFRNSIRNGTEFFLYDEKSHPMTSWKDCTNWEYESLRNSRPYWNCTIWRFIRRKLDLVITDWKLLWKEVSSKIYEKRIFGPETEIMKETPWSRIRGHNSVYKEVQGDCWQWKSQRAVCERRQLQFPPRYE